jgi:hypothetical protein
MIAFLALRHHQDSDIKMVDVKENQGPQVVAPRTSAALPLQMMEKVWTFHTRLIKDVLLPRSKSLSSIRDHIFHHSPSTNIPRPELQTKNVKVVTRQDILNGVYKVPRSKSSPTSPRTSTSHSVPLHGPHLNRRHSSKKAARSNSTIKESVQGVQSTKSAHGIDIVTEATTIRPPLMRPSMSMLSDDGLLMVPVDRSITRDSQISDRT